MATGGLTDEEIPENGRKVAMRAGGGGRLQVDGAASAKVRNLACLQWPRSSREAIMTGVELTRRTIIGIHARVLARIR